LSIKPYFTSNGLVEAVKRSMSMPISQITFSEEDILAFATEELFMSQMPSILQYHEEYYVFEQSVPLVNNQSRYPIPNRAIGMKLRDLFYVDNQGQMIEMSKINPDDEAHFSIDSNSNNSPIYYKIQNNSIKIIPDVSANVQGSLLFTYYLRPNSLVPDEKAAICTAFSKTITFDNNPTAGDSITINGDTFEAGVDYVIGANSSITASNFNTAVLGTDLEVTTVVTGNVIDVHYEDRNLEISTDSSDVTVQQTITVVCADGIDDEIDDGSLVDILQADGGHTTYAIDVKLASGAVSSTSITLNESNLSDNFVLGDYICLQYQCIIPQIPTDLHILLAERTAARLLQSIGDREGLKEVKEKLGDYEARQATLIDSRVEGAPQKIFNRHSLLRIGKQRSGRGL